MTDSFPVVSDNPQLVPVFPGQIGGRPAQVCDGRTLHTFLENDRQFADWIKQRIEQYGFQENQDFALISQKSEIKPSRAYPSHIAPHRAIGCGNPEIRRTSRHPCGFFCVRRLPPSFMGGSGGEPRGSPVPNPGLPTRLTARPAWQRGERNHKPLD